MSSSRALFESGVLLCFLLAFISLVSEGQFAALYGKNGLVPLTPSNGRGPGPAEPLQEFGSRRLILWGSRPGALTVRYHHRRLENSYKFQWTPGASPRSLVDFSGSLNNGCGHVSTGSLDDIHGICLLPVPRARSRRLMPSDCMRVSALTWPDRRTSWSTGRAGQPDSASWLIRFFMIVSLVTLLR